VILDRDSEIPSEWKKIPGWDKAVARVWRTRYQWGFKLLRSIAQEDPGLFVRNVLTALRAEPSYTLGRLLRGFPWPPDSPEDKDPATVAHRLIALFDAPWPPVAFPVTLQS
jgi:hypothetical protein